MPKPVYRGDNLPVNPAHPEITWGHLFGRKNVYVDEPIWPFRGMMMCHMIADEVEDLHRMADKIGVDRKWFQSAEKHRYPHYDIAKSKRALAVKFGAVEIDKREFVKRANELVALHAPKRPQVINVGRNGIFGGLFGNPVNESEVSAQYHGYLKRVIAQRPEEAQWLSTQIANGAILQCPGCGANSPTCHARVIEEMLGAKIIPVSVYTDGSASFKAGDGGWAFVALKGDAYAEIYGFQDQGKTGEMELTAIYEAFKWLPFGPSPIRLFSDSQYAVNTLNVWADRWALEGWYAGNAERKHVDLIQRIMHLLAEHRKHRAVTIAWIPGHRKHVHNERADKLAGQARKGKLTNL